MLLITDRIDGCGPLRRALEQVERCPIVQVHHAGATHESVLVCDVALHTIADVQVLRAALSKARVITEAPILFLARDPSHLTWTHARELGATEIAPVDTSPMRLQAILRRLIATARSKPTGLPGSDAGLAIARARELGAPLAAIFESARHHQLLSIAGVERGGDAVLMAMKQQQIRAWLEIVWHHDDATYQHCLLVAGLVADFTIKLGFSLPLQRTLSQAALVHDIGKSRVPTQILNKPSPLTAAEAAVMKTHARIGADIIAQRSRFNPILVEVASRHHEMLDGSGYTEGLRADRLSHHVRLVTICDIFGALIERRPYKGAMPSDDAYGVLVAMDGKLDQTLVAAFKKTAMETAALPAGLS